MSELEYRTATQLGVDFPKRTIEIIVTPWEQETEVEHKGRMIREVFSRGAYDGIERRPNRIRVNRDHDVRRVIGRAVALHPSRQEGLVAELRIARTDLGDETLALADDGDLDASAEFAVMPGGDTWQGRLRRITKAWLGGVAMTPVPAYPGANVLSVRQASAVTVATPNLDQIRGWRLQQLYDLTQH